MMKAETILVIDDDVEIRRLVFKTLTPAGYKVKLAKRQGDPLRQVFSTRCSLVILGEDSMDQSYVHILKDIREWSAVPVIVLSSLVPKEAVIAASVDGANGYITVPFSRPELLTSVQTVLQSYNTTSQGRKFEADSVVIDFENRTVTKKGKRVELTKTEFSLLSLFVHNADKLLTHDFILRQIWGPWFETTLPYSHVYVGRLRKKLEDNPDQPQLFQTELGKGYRFVVKQ
jgi:two-component system, OmpR family, KDP operon response regulator KdpE